jgi:hypothetical protein
MRLGKPLFLGLKLWVLRDFWAEKWQKWAVFRGLCLLVGTHGIHIKLFIISNLRQSYVAENSDFRVGVGGYFTFRGGVLAAHAGAFVAVGKGWSFGLFGDP